ncbi:transcriptional regulator, IclR family [Pseudonocardia ammonioxydans]|uniref:Transcriptional regulator, IclR family n=1 Tax=Pseudonocardia ammonioxydans TaxID=260086 RepID=A0A1I5FHH3_PSUAM|nr:IclR family transcriptional regulator [Pseudonocardia ammonioxydans]SFO23185.1 transcriptional regulator, IclR family [Pseudonocardia ammonioxydans]
MLQTVQKIGPVLDLFTIERPEWGVSEVAESIGVPRSSAHALLSSLVEVGLLHCRSRGRYRIGWRIVELGETLRGSYDLRAAAAPVLQDMVERYGETTHLAVMERNRVLYVDKVIGTHVINVLGARVGASLDPHCNAVGKVLLAHRTPAEIERFVDTPLRRLTPSTITEPRALAKELETVRRAGCAFDRGEAVLEVHCVAAPVRDDLGAVVGAISMTVPAGRFAPAQSEYKRAVVTGASEISRRIATAAEPPRLAVVRDDPCDRLAATS